MMDELRNAPRFERTFCWPGHLLGEARATRSLYTEEGDAVHFDLEGRWTRARLGGQSYLRGLDGAVLARFRGRSGEDERVEDVAAVHARVVALVQRAAGGCPVPLSDWSVERLLGEAARFRAAQGHVGILPPDRYRSLVLQVTQGCAYNGCLFCSLYKGQRHRVLTPGEFRVHAEAVMAFVGSGISERRGLFLGEANALAAPMASLVAALEVAHGLLPGLARDVSSFIDAFDTWRTVEEFRTLAALGLRRIFVGVESGDAETLALLGKPATPEGVTGLVRSAKEGGVSVGVIFLAGLGPAHVEASVRLREVLPLDSRDVVYVSPLVVDPKGRLALQLSRRGLALPPGPGDVEAEADLLRSRLRGSARVARYDVRRWVYT